MDGLKGLVSSQLLGAAAKQFGESESGISSAISGMAATLLHGLADKSDDTNAFSGLFESLSGNKTDGFLDDLGGLLGGGNLAQGDPKDIAGGFIGRIFGDKVGDILGAVAGASGISRNSSSGLLGMVGPMVMGYLGKRIMGGGLDALGLKNLLGAEKQAFAAAVPAQVQPLIGIAPQTTAAAASVTHGEPVKAGGGWLWPLVMIAAAIGLLLFLLRGCSDDTGQAADQIKDTGANVHDRAVETVTTSTEAVSEVTTDVGSAVSETVSEVTDSVADYSVDLGGFTLSGNADGVEAGLLNFIESGAEPCTDAACWFNFDRLTFATGSADLDMNASGAQLENIAQIMKAHENIQLKIGGYTDNTGSEDLNMTLSQQRAEAVIAAVVARGIGADRLVGEGYGSQFPVASNDSAEGRAQNRRIAVRVRSR